MSRLAYLMRLFSKDESGAALVEYAVIFAVILAGTVGLLGIVSDQLGAVFTLIADTLGVIGGLVPGAP